MAGSFIVRLNRSGRRLSRPVSIKRRKCGALRSGQDGAPVLRHGHHVWVAARADRADGGLSPARLRRRAKRSRPACPDARLALPNSVSALVEASIRRAFEVRMMTVPIHSESMDI